MLNIKQSSTCTECDRKCEAFKQLSTDELQHINAHRFQTRFNAGETVFRQGSPASNVVAVSQGIVSISLMGIDNRNLILDIVTGPVLLGGPGIYVDNTYHYTVKALSNVRVCLVDSTEFKNAIRSNGVFADYFITEFSRRAIITYQKAVSLTQKHMNGRMAEALIFFGDEIYNSPNYEMPLSRQELAEYTNMTKESACRILKKMKDDHLIDYNNNHFQLLDRHRLHDTAQHG
jgi:CRP/FNR family transcriptional regulator